jgi:hypothetical protein
MAANASAINPKKRSQLHDHLLLAEAQIHLLAEALEASDH